MVAAKTVKKNEARTEVNSIREENHCHDSMVEIDVEKMRAKLKPGHVIHTLVSEHDIILGFLDELEKVNQSIQKMENYQEGKEEFKYLKHITKHLIEVEAHHKREEEVLFPEVEKRGVSGPPQVMIMEHEDLRRRKKELKELAGNISKIDFNEFKRHLSAIVKFIVITLREHISKENNVLYPAALEVIKEDKVWLKMKDECDKIGYCCFTPRD